MNKKLPTVSKCVYLTVEEQIFILAMVEQQIKAIKLLIDPLAGCNDDNTAVNKAYDILAQIQHAILYSTINAPRRRKNP